LDVVATLWVSSVGVLTLLTAAWLIAVVDCAYRRYATRREKLLWVAVTVLGHCLGAVLYWFLGRERGTLGPV
jgi:hypothetical protein